jgi:hypothetical protein
MRAAFALLSLVFGVACSVTRDGRSWFSAREEERSRTPERQGVIETSRFPRPITSSLRGDAGQGAVDMDAAVALVVDADVLSGPRKLVELRLEAVVGGRIDLTAAGKGVALARYQEPYDGDVDAAVVMETAIIVSHGELQRDSYPALERPALAKPPPLSREIAPKCATFDEVMADGAGRWLVSVSPSRLAIRAPSAPTVSTRPPATRAPSPTPHPTLPRPVHPGTIDLETW